MTTQINENKAPTKIWNSVFVSAFIANMALYLGMYISNSLVAKYADSLGASATSVGIVMSMFAITAMGFKILSGPAIDTFNRKFVMMGAMLILAAAFFGYGISKSIAMLKVFRLLQGTAQAFTATCALVIAADSLPPDKMSSGIGFFSLAQAACMAIGPTIALFLQENIGYSWTFVISGGCVFVAIVAISRIKIKHKRTKKFKISIHNILAKEVFMPTAVMFFITMSFCLINSYLIIYAGRQGIETNIGYFFTVFAVTMLVSRPTIGKLADKYGVVKVMMPALLIFVGSFFLVSYSKTLIMFLASAVLMGFGFGACQPTMQALSMKCVTKERRGAASSTNYIGNDLGNLVSPVIAGMIVESIGYAAMWRIMVFPMVIAMAILIAYRSKIYIVEESFKTAQ